MHNQTATEFLKNKKTNLPNREQVAREATAMFREQESELATQMIKEIPEDDPERVGKANMLRMITREMATNDMVEFLDNL